MRYEVGGAGGGWGSLTAGVATRQSAPRVPLALVACVPEGREFFYFSNLDCIVFGVKKFTFY